MKQQNLPESYSKQDAILMAGFSYQTYPFFDQQQLALPAGFELRYSFNGKTGVTEKTEENFGFIAESEDRLVLAFRGTDSTPNLDSDLDLFQIPFPYVKNAGSSHRGITRVYQSLREEVIEQISQLPDTKKLYITGHSLGGDLSIMAALDFAVNTARKEAIVYTIAAGRPGDRDFVGTYNAHVKNSYRIFNVHDFIPTLPAAEYPAPFTEAGLFYEHVNASVPIGFQMDNLFLNHRINCYFQKLGEQDINYMNALRSSSPGFCPEPINLKELADSMKNN
ncbi:lipase family protein [Acetobacterium carbinolicum]|jgi:triacylglycerol lipase|uniref:lipase family protein n=1 Tax=Acetobacterium TaxID=33951 RepID=UPI000DBEB818|nr:MULTISPECIES: lipase family protein [unclassified Acetobacterium]AWW25577.1 lipase family protein [Acetobacterium sp. KB-1]MDZ5724523.1 lipase family protein [Acetobacterium sp. K1/6]